ERLALALAPRGAGEGLHHLGQAPAPFFGGLVVMVDADDGEAVRKLSGSHEIVERWHDKPLGQITAGAKNRQRGGRKGGVGRTLCGSCRGVCSNRRHRSPPPPSDVVEHLLRRGEGALASRPMSALLTFKSTPSTGVRMHRSIHDAFCN